MLREKTSDWQWIAVLVMAFMACACRADSAAGDKAASRPSSGPSDSSRRTSATTTATTQESGGELAIEQGVFRDAMDFFRSHHVLLPTIIGGAFLLAAKKLLAGLFMWIVKAVGAALKRFIKWPGKEPAMGPPASPMGMTNQGDAGAMQTAAGDMNNYYFYLGRGGGEDRVDPVLATGDGQSIPSSPAPSTRPRQSSQLPAPSSLQAGFSYCEEVSYRPNTQSTAQPVNLSPEALNSLIADAESRGRRIERELMETTMGSSAASGMNELEAQTTALADRLRNSLLNHDIVEIDRATIELNTWIEGDGQKTAASIRVDAMLALSEAARQKAIREAALGQQPDLTEATRLYAIAEEIAGGQ